MMTLVTTFIQMGCVLLLVMFSWSMLHPAAPMGKALWVPPGLFTASPWRKRLPLRPSWRWNATMRTLVAYGACVLVSLLYASFSLVARDALSRLDALVFTALQLVLLTPCACWWLLRWRRLCTQDLLLRGLLLGGCLAAALICLTWSFKMTGISETTMFTSLNGLMAAGIALLVFRQRLRRATWLACLLSIVGIVLIWSASAQHWQGNMTALVGGSLMTVFAFLIERLCVSEVTREPARLWPLLGVMLLTMAAMTLISALCFGNWQTLHLLHAQDAFVLLYTSIGTILVPLILSMKAQRYVSAVTMAFLALIEPIASAACGFLLGERLAALAYVGGGVILLGVLLQAGASLFPEQSIATMTREITDLNDTTSGEEDNRVAGVEPEQRTASDPQDRRPFRVPSRPTLPPRRPRLTRGMLLTLVGMLSLFSAGLVPALAAPQPVLLHVPLQQTRTMPVGELRFTSSGQLDPTNAHGLNDIVTVQVHALVRPAQGRQEVVWLLPDQTNDELPPLLLGRLSFSRGMAQLTYTDPEHQNLLASYSGVVITEVPDQQRIITLPLDPRTWLVAGSLPGTPTPGDAHHYSYLDHLRHLLARDPTLSTFGLQGGLVPWLARNTEKILEWSSAARDNWAGGQQTALIHRHMVRVLQYLDGITLAAHAGDVPADTPVLVDPAAGRVGLLEIKQAQSLPAYLTHVDLHVNGLAHAPGHTAAQARLALQIDAALTKDRAQLEAIRQDALRLVRMDTAQLTSSEALTRLNDMVTHATTAYTGTLDPTTGATTGGSVWIASSLQGLATITLTTVPDKQG